MESTQINVLSFPLETSVHLGVTKFSRWVVANPFPFNVILLMPCSLILVSQNMLSPCPFLWSLSLYLFLLLYSAFWVPSEFHLPFTFLHLALATPLQGFIQQLHASTPLFLAFQGSTYLLGLLIPVYRLSTKFHFIDHSSFLFFVLIFPCKLIVSLLYIQLFWFHFLVALSLSHLSVSTSPGSISHSWLK